MTIDPDMALLFLGFVEARHQAWENRQNELPAPWTDDPIVATRKFTNVFRVIDYGSQFVLTDLIDNNIDRDTQLMRLFLYRHTGRVEVWKYLRRELGRYPDIDDLDDTLEIFQDYRNLVDKPIFTSAYLVYPQSSTPGTDKIESIIDLTWRLFAEERVVPQAFFNAETQEERFAALRRNKGVADFMSMQILTDWGYTPHCGEDLEDDFIVAGPGARKGAAYLSPRSKAEDVVGWAVEAIRSLGTVRLPGGRVPSYMDAQNCLCEFSKYVRYLEKPVPDRTYSPAHPGKHNVVLPKHWRKEPE